jgi:hypothetical protein
MEVIRITELENYRSLLYEIRDLATGGARYVADMSGDKKDIAFNFAMFNTISRNAAVILRLFDTIEFMPEVEEKIRLEYRTVSI